MRRHRASTTRVELAPMGESGQHLEIVDPLSLDRDQRKRLSAQLNGQNPIIGMHAARQLIVSWRIYDRRSKPLPQLRDDPSVLMRVPALTLVELFRRLNDALAAPHDLN